VFGKFETVRDKLLKYRYPSTTTRTPRSLTQFLRYKGSEYRLVLLFGAAAFRRCLGSVYYKHYLLLVCALHLAESRSIEQSDIDDIRFLLGKIICILLTESQQTLLIIRYLSASVPNFVYQPAESTSNS
jgi:hypothetical protein